MTYGVENLSEIARAMRMTSSSVLSDFNMLIPCKMKRQLNSVYPNSGLILSRLGEKILGRFLLPRTNGKPEISQNPVYRLFPHSWVKEQGNFFLFARLFAPMIKSLHGEVSLA